MTKTYNIFKQDMDIKGLLEVAGVDTTQGKAKQLVEQQNKKNTKVTLSGDVYIVNASWDDIWNKLDDSAESFVKMLKNDGEFSVSKTSEPQTITVKELVHIIDVGTTSAEMDMGHGFDEDDD